MSFRFIFFVLALAACSVNANPLEKNKANKASHSASSIPHFPLPETYFPNQETADAYGEIQHPYQKETDDYFESQGFSEQSLPNEADILPSVSSLQGKAQKPLIESGGSDHIPQNPLVHNKNFKVDDVPHKPRNILQND